MSEGDWVDDLDNYRIEYPFDGNLQAIEIDESEVDDELLERCVDVHIVSHVANGYLITHKDIEGHQEKIQENGLEAYLRERLESVDD